MAVVAGATGALVTWLVAVPWHLSGGGGGGSGGTPTVGVVAAAGVASALGLVFGQVSPLRRRIDAATLTAAGTGTWTVLFAWRVALAQDDPARVLVPLLLFVVPAAIALPLAVGAMTDWSDARDAAAGTSRGDGGSGDSGDLVAEPAGTCPRPAIATPAALRPRGLPAAAGVVHRTPRGSATSGSA
jgi:hypothetical protein